MKARKRRKIVALLLPLCMLVTLVMSRTNVISARAEEDPPAGVGCWIENQGYEEAPGAVKLTYADGTSADMMKDPETGDDVYFFKPKSTLKLAVKAGNGAQESVAPEDIDAEIEFFAREVSSVLDFEALLKGNSCYIAETNMVEVEFTLPADIDFFCVRVFWDGRGLQGPALNTVRVEYEDRDASVVNETTNGIIKESTLPEYDGSALPYMDPGLMYDYEFTGESHSLSFKITPPEDVPMEDVNVAVQIIGDDPFWYRSSIETANGANRPLTLNEDGSFSFEVPACYERDEVGEIIKDEEGNDIVIGYAECVVYVSWTPAGSGSSKILEAATQYIYAYTSAYDFNGDGKVMDKADNYTDDLRYALASELYRKFIWVGQYGELNFLGTPHNDFDYGHNKPVIDQVYEQIKMEPAGTITAKDAAGGSVMLDRYKATVAWGIDEKTREPLVSELYVYDLPDEQTPEGEVFFNHILICTDFNETTGNGNTFYLRDIRNDRKNFSDYKTDEYDTDGDNGIVIYDSGANAVIGGYDSVSDVISQSENMTSITQSIYPENMTIFDQSYTVHVRFMNPEATYIAVHSEGEALRYDGMGLNGFAGDSICETGDDVTTAVYVGDTKVVLSPVLADGLTTSDIADVRLKDAKQAAGVNIDKSDLASIEVEFLSNFYDTVTFVIEYIDGTENEITIIRQGLIIRYHFVDGNKDNENMNYDCWGEGNEFKGPNYTYDYQAGEQIMIFATYYHPSNYATLSGDDSLNLVVTYADGTTEVITADNEEHNYHGYAEGSAYGSVDTTSFIIDFIPVTENNEAQNYKGGFNALVVNGGYDDPDTFGGAQLGSGKGVYWNGDLKFN